MAHCKFLLTLMISVSYLFGMTGNAVGQTSASAIAGFNLGAAPSQDPIFVDWIIQEEHWMLQVDLIFDPSAGPMQKHFESPKDAGGTPILLDAQQPFPQTLWEEFLILPPPTAPNGFNVTDWHEEIHTPGWEWVEPDDSRFPDLFPAGESLITKDGVPWPSQPIPMPNPDPAKLWVEFPPIEPGHVLDVHKALLWIGTPGNRTWGDGVDDAGNSVPESFIDVWEYPTPEPSTFAIASLVALGMLVWRRR